MKRKLLAGTALVFALAIGWAGCGSSGNVCEDAANVMFDAMKEACAQQSGCCYCDCLLQGKFMDFSNLETCTCLDVDPTGSGGTTASGCDEEAKQMAEECLANVEKCKSDAAEGIPDLCSMGG